MDITGIPKALILATLFNNAKAVGLSVFHHNPSEVMTVEEAEEILKSTVNFDYYRGRLLKIRFNLPGSDKENEFDTALYNRDYGDQAAENLIKDAMGWGTVNLQGASEIISEMVADKPVSVTPCSEVKSEKRKAGKDPAKT